MKKIFLALLVLINQNTFAQSKTEFILPDTKEAKLINLLLRKDAQECLASLKNKGFDGSNFTTSARKVMITEDESMVEYVITIDSWEISPTDGPMNLKDVSDLTIVFKKSMTESGLSYFVESCDFGAVTEGK